MEKQEAIAWNTITWICPKCMQEHTEMCSDSLDFYCDTCGIDIRVVIKEPLHKSSNMV